MKTILMGLLAETSIHPGAGRNLGVVDLPVAREAATDFPVLVGSSLKGALRDSAEQLWGHKDSKVTSLYGKQDNAGELVVSDGRLVLLPVRSLTGSSRWVTCPQILERLLRDFTRAGMNPGFLIPTVAGTDALAQDDTGGALFLEERQFTVSGAPGDAIIDALGKLIAYDETRERLKSRLVIVADKEFTWFARYGLPIQARNTLDNATKTSKNLWYEESLPPDTVMSALLIARRGNALDKARAQLDGSTWLQTGGNETVGQGWFKLSVNGADKQEA